MNASAILDVQRLTKSYRTNSGELTVLKDISFVLGPGATCSILGPSGSGKTTLLGLCAGLDLPTSGHVCLNGIALDEIGEDERARVRNQLVGFVFQSFQLIPTLTALENVTVPMELRGDRTARQQGLELLERVGSRSAFRIFRPNCPAANNNASRWRGRSLTSRLSYSPTSPREIWTRRQAGR